MRVGAWALVFAAAVAISVLSVSPGIAIAADADELIRQGVALRRAGDDAGALQRFEQAFQIDHSSRALAQVGLAEQALGRWVAAAEHLNRALDDARDPWIAKSRATIRQALDHVNEHVGHLEVLGGSRDAEVLIDGRSRGKLPLAGPLAVAAGTVTIELKAPKLVPVQRTIVVQARQTIRESFDALVPVFTAGESPASSDVASPESNSAARRQPPAEAVAVPVATTLAIPPAETVPSVPGKSAPDRGENNSFRPKLKWVMWGTSAAALTAGIFGLVRQTHAASDFDGGCAVDSGQNVVVAPGSNQTASGCRSLKDRVDSSYRIELIGFVGAGVLAATGFVLWLTEPAPVHGETSALACRPGVTGGYGPWVGCGLRF